MNNITCPSCDRGGFDSKKGMRIHHAKSHGESIAGERVECDNCGESFTRPKSHLEYTEHNFCSRECSSEYQSKQLTVDCDACGESFEIYSWRVDKYDKNYCSKKCQAEGYSNRVEVQCFTCGESLLVKPYWAEKNERHFCDRKCWRNRPTGVQVECSFCGASIKVEPYYAEKRENHFCDKECEGKWLAKNRVGENHPQYTGHDGYYGANWHKQRRRALKRDGHECQRCGIAEEECRDQYGFALSVHHYEPQSEFDDKEEANRIDNLVTVCSSCHYDIEGKPIVQQRFETKSPVANPGLEAFSDVQKPKRGASEWKPE